MTKFLVVHPGRQHSHQLAWALEEAGLLGLYVHGSPLPQAICQAIPSSRRRFLPLAPAVNKLASKLLNQKWQAHARYISEWVFASVVNATLRMGRYSHVVAYENAALPLFQTAREQGVHAILDAASIHHTDQDKLRRYPESDQLHAKLTARKDAEVQLAQTLLTCSNLARDSYLQNGVAPGRLHTILLGAETSARNSDPNLAPSGSPRLLFVGRLTAHKGIDILIAALKSVQEMGRPFSATIVADLGGADAGLVADLSSVATLAPTMSADKLNQLYASSDCLILPSRFDSFGMVVPEALVQGCPALVSFGAGASALVRPEENGMVFPAGDVAALRAAILSFLDNLSNWRARRAEIADDARRFAWSRYRAELTRMMQTIVASETPPQNDINH